MAPRKRKTTEEDATADVTDVADAAVVGAAAGGRAPPRRSPRMYNSDGAGAEPAKEKPVKKGVAKKEKEMEEEEDDGAEVEEEEEMGDVAEKPAATEKVVKKGRGKKAKIEEKDKAPAAVLVKEKPAKKGRGKKAKVDEKEEKTAVDEKVEEGKDRAAEEEEEGVTDVAEEEKHEVTADGDSGEAEKEEGEEAEKKAGHGSKTIVIEHCKQCNAFKTRANLVKDGLEKVIAGITVLINPEKPRRGCFEIREEGGETFITLLDMKRPFQPMKDLDMEKVISDIIEKIK